MLFGEFVHICLGNKWSSVWSNVRNANKTLRFLCTPIVQIKRTMRNFTVKTEDRSMRIATYQKPPAAEPHNIPTSTFFIVCTRPSPSPRVALWRRENFYSALDGRWCIRARSLNCIHAMLAASISPFFFLTFLLSFFIAVSILEARM